MKPFFFLFTFLAPIKLCSEETLQPSPTYAKELIVDGDHLRSYLILSSLKRYFGKYPKQLIFTKISFGCYFGKCCRVRRISGWQDIGLPCGLNGETVPREKEMEHPEPPNPYAREPREAVRDSMHMSGICFCQKQSGASGLTGAGRWHACHHCQSHHYRTQQSRRTMLIIMENGFLFWGGSEGGEKAAPGELRPWGWPRFKIGIAG